jgi:hypothetical protein
VLEYEGVQPDELATLLDYSYRLEQYTFMPQYTDAESFGRYMLDPYNVPEKIKQFVNLHEFGKSQLAESNMKISSYGVIRPEYGQVHEPAYEPEPEQGQTMGGMGGM